MKATQVERGRDNETGTDTTTVGSGGNESTGVYSRADGPALNDPVPARAVETVDENEHLDSLSADSIFDVLSNRRRRSTITYLNRAEEEPVQLRDLAEQIAAWENGVAPEEVTYKERKRVYTSLYQSHLDKMDRLGLLEYDRNRGTIESTPATAELEQFLDDVNEDDRSHQYAPVGVAVGCVVLVAAAWTGIIPAASQSGFGVAFAVAVVFLAVTGFGLLADD